MKPTSRPVLIFSIWLPAALLALPVLNSKAYSYDGNFDRGASLAGFNSAFENAPPVAQGIPAGPAAAQDKDADEAIKLIASVLGPNRYCFVYTVRKIHLRRAQRRQVWNRYQADFWKRGMAYFEDPTNEEGYLAKAANDPAYRYWKGLNRTATEGFPARERYIKDSSRLEALKEALRNSENSYWVGFEDRNRETQGGDLLILDFSRSSPDGAASPQVITEIHYCYDDL